MFPFIKWVGGKRQLIKELEKRVPKEFDSKKNTYFEPFVGGGALFFHLKPSKAVISDKNKELIHAYKTMRFQYKKVLELLILMEFGHSEDFFLSVRKLDRLIKEDNRGLEFNDFSPVLKAARFIYLNKAGFNGMYRVNSKGYYNVPSGKKDKVKTYEIPNIIKVSEYLKNNDIKIMNVDFIKAVKSAKKGDFVYFDPPYDYEEGIKGFVSYQKNGFGKENQVELANLCKKLNKEGVYFMASNHNTKLIRELYKEFNIEIIMAKRMINSNGKKRGKVEEVIIRNY